MANPNNPYAGASSYSMNAPELAPTPNQGPDQAPAEAAPRPQPEQGGFGQPLFGQAPAQGGGDLIKDTTTAGFTKDVIQESRNQPVLVDFWAPWCGPCKQLTPIIEKEVLAAGGAVKLVKMNIDDHPAVAGQLGIQSIPAVIAFKNGQPVDGFMGAVPPAQVAAFIKKLGGDGAKEAIAEALLAAKEARTAGDIEAAAQIYEMILQQAPETIEAIAGAAELAYEAGEVEAAEALLSTAPEAKVDAPELAALRARMTLDKEVSALGDASEFEQRLAANPKDHQARLDLALIQNARGEREAAADSLLAIMRADRTWNDDGARAQLLKLFEAWGPMDEATLTARRKLSSLLFS